MRAQVNTYIVAAIAVYAIAVARVARMLGTDARLSATILPPGYVFVAAAILVPAFLVFLLRIKQRRR